MKKLNIMKNILLTLALLISFVSFGQTFEDFSYIKINSNDNGYDITSVAEDIFEEKGFTILREGDITPTDALKDPCLVLNCKIKYKRGKTGWSNSKIELSLIDCKQRVIYNKKASSTTNFDTNDVAVNLSKATSGIMVKAVKVSNSKTKKIIGWAGNGSGIIVSQNGYIITNNHVIKDANEIEIEVLINDEVQKLSAQVVQQDARNDLAIIRVVDINFDRFSSINYNFKTRSSDVGTKIYTYGYPKALTGMGKEIKITEGIISSKTGIMGDITTYQITAPIQGGNSGGPLFDENANLIGINSSKFNSENTENVNYSIKSSYVMNLIDVLPKSIDLPSSTKLQSLPLTEQIKEISKYVVLIKVK